ncbi:TPA_asm: hypothetical protein [ssRNA phage Gerhypos.4_21]|uniref:Uncharacterized protein n=2 Tax=Leviviricetes TaxID=2842243 RepID=A0A8S5KYR4_9VIRU|nr:hypothetical protein QIN86_gp3 [ssRNA phage Gerhypos.4_21]QDH91322.1 MAG: hypothetical protein H4Bulk46504_000003 [Leviviridae sp.]DAD50456.1 TPA_asm: hypothetical protein [ssRNA phage Gerhypos.4_21]
MDRRGYDYNHATSGMQFLAIIVILAICILGGLTLGLVLLTSIL